MGFLPLEPLIVGQGLPTLPDAARPSRIRRVAYRRRLRLGGTAGSSPPRNRSDRYFLKFKFKFKAVRKPVPSACLQWQPN